MLYLKDEELFCPYCSTNEYLWIKPTYFYKVICKKCGKQWEYNKLVKICVRLIKKAIEYKSSQWDVICYRILLRHTINPFTGKNYENI